MEVYTATLRILQPSDAANNSHHVFVRIVALALLRFIPGVEKTPNHLREVSLERANQNKWNIDKTVPSVAFHKLCNTAISIDMHHNKKAAPVFDLYDLTQEGDF